MTVNEARMDSLWSTVFNLTILSYNMPHNALRGPGLSFPFKSINSPMSSGNGKLCMVGQVLLPQGITHFPMVNGRNLSRYHSNAHQLRK
jgi:hypothetical protein